MIPLPVRGELYEVTQDWSRRTKRNQDRNRDWKVGDRFIVDVVEPPYWNKPKDPKKVPWVIQVLFWGRRYWVNTHFLEHSCVRLD